VVKVKICGITNLADAQSAVTAGCDALGFVFYKKSPRYVAPETARVIIREVPRGIMTIGVFVNAPEKTIKTVARQCRLDILQFHGDESAAFCEKFKNYKIIKAFRITHKLALKKIMHYRVFAYLFDTFVPARRGGTGKRFDWKLLTSLSTIDKTIFLSGGLNPENVQRAIHTAHPAWVDVSSGVESSPGKKNAAQIKRFVARAKKA
jgi:phosphoribosylanthranilate isomerase